LPRDGYGTVRCLFVSLSVRNTCVAFKDVKNERVYDYLLLRRFFVVAGGSPSVPSGLPSAAYYRSFVGCVAYVRLGTRAGAPAAARRRENEARKHQRLDLVADRDAHDTLAFCDDDDDDATTASHV